MSSSTSDSPSLDSVIGEEIFPSMPIKKKSKKQKIPEAEPKKNSSDSTPDDDIDPKLKKIIKNSTADMWNRLRKTWIAYVNIENDLTNQNLEPSEQHKIALQKTYLENIIEKYLNDLELDSSVFKTSPILVNDIGDKIE